MVADLCHLIHNLSSKETSPWGFRYPAHERGRRATKSSMTLHDELNAPKTRVCGELLPVTRKDKGIQVPFDSTDQLLFDNPSETETKAIGLLTQTVSEVKNVRL